MLSLAATKDVLASAVLDLYKKGRYEEAVARGLSNLLVEPWNHELRFIVADSLQRIGKNDEATTQFEALEGTNFSETATLRLNALRKLGQLPARKLSLQASTTTPSGAAQQLAQYQYVAPTDAGLSGKSLPSELVPPKTASSRRESVGLPKRSQAKQHIVDLNAAEDYQAAGTEGLALLSKEKLDDELQLIVANSLAWSGREKDAIPAYQDLAKGEYANEANVGLANIYRWSGRDDQAAPLYLAVLAADPGNAGAVEGLELATRELSPRTMLSFGGSIDSSDMQRRSAAINHRWRDSSRSNIMEIETSRVRDSLPNSQADQQDVSFRYQALNLALKPSFELSIPAKAEHVVYGSAHLKLSENLTSLDVGRVNWGRIATNPNALASNLAASHIGLEATQAFSFGNLVGRIDYFDISDGNNMLTSSLRLASKWRPLGSHIKPFLGVETRAAKFNTPNYWSPDHGFGTLYAGLLGEWGRTDWNVYAAGQAGLRLYGDAGASWSLSAGGKRWVSSDVAISMNLWDMASWRDNAYYRAKSVSINLEKLWK